MKHIRCIKAVDSVLIYIEPNRFFAVITDEDVVQMLFGVLGKKRNADMRYAFSVKDDKLRGWHHAAVEHTVTGFDTLLDSACPIILPLPLVTVESRTTEQPVDGNRVGSDTKGNQSTQGTVRTRLVYCAVCMEIFAHVTLVI